MNSALEEFVDAVPEFDNITPGERVEYFVYFLTQILDHDCVPPSAVKECFELTSLADYSIRQYLNQKSKRGNKRKPIFVKRGSGYCLARDRLIEIEGKLSIKSPKKKVSTNLRELLSKITSPSEKEFLEEAISCYEIEAYRAAIVMGWILAVDHIYEYIFADKDLLSDFNQVLSKEKNKKFAGLIINNKDDFSDIPESVFIRLCRSSKIISNDVRKIMDEKLGTRNSSAHPSGITIRESKATDFLEDLIVNIIMKY